MGERPKPLQEAARLRDEVKRLKRLDLEFVGSAGTLAAMRLSRNPSPSMGYGIHTSWFAVLRAV
jgi:hypothetical protein